jgi:ADP-ribosylglycohydrolase
MSPCQTVAELFAKGLLPIHQGGIFQDVLAPNLSSHLPDRMGGMLLGLAVGDALGNTSEGLLPRERRQRHGEIGDYLPNCNAEGRAVGLPSDDTQLAFWTLECLLADGIFDPDHVARAFTSNGKVYGMGGSVREFLRNYKDRGLPWYEAGAESAGNGALMRIAPVVIPHLRNGGTSLWTDAACGALITHRDSMSVASCVAFCGMLAELMRMTDPPQPEWWAERFTELAGPLETARYSPRGGTYATSHGTLAAFVAEVVPAALLDGLSAVEACDRWYSGAYLLETVPSVLYILARHGHDPEQAIVRAVNDTKDNDTVAAIVGAAVGALHGQANLPSRWLAGLSGRTRAGDEGRVQELVAKAISSGWMGEAAGSGVG